MVRRIRLLIAFACLLVLGFDLWLVISARQQEVQTQTTANEKLASSVASHINSTLLDVEHILDYTVFEIENTEYERAELAKLQPALAHKVAQAQQLHGLFIYDAAGTWLLNSQSIKNSGRNNSDRDYFKFHRDNPSRETHLSLPVVSRSTGTWIWPVSRRLNYADGSFAGVALATVKLEFVRTILSEFTLGEDGATALALNGHLVVRVPYNEADIARNVSNQPIIKRLRLESSGTSEERSVIDHVDRIISFDHARHFPIAAVVAVGRDEVLAGWWQRSTIQTSVVLTLCVIIIVAGRFLVRAAHTKAFDEQNLRRIRDELTIANQQLARLALDDGLTGIPNRRLFDQRLANLWANSRRYKRSLGLVLVDIDNFKGFNDLYGHVAGDDCLRQVALSIKQSVQRPEDLVARYGGEEIAILLPETDVKGLTHVAERIRRTVEMLSIKHTGSSSQVVTISLGLAHTSQAKSSAIEHFVEYADRNLYLAKNAGRNCAIGP